jgi:hypothetical protein
MPLTLLELEICSGMPITTVHINMPAAVILKMVSQRQNIYFFKVLNFLCYTYIAEYFSANYKMAAE